MITCPPRKLSCGDKITFAALIILALPSIYFGMQEMSLEMNVLHAKSNATYSLCISILTCIFMGYTLANYRFLQQIPALLGWGILTSAMASLNAVLFAPSMAHLAYHVLLAWFWTSSMLFAYVASEKFNPSLRVVTILALFIMIPATVFFYINAAEKITYLKTPGVNEVYYLVVFVPWALIFRPRWLQYGVVASVIIALLHAGKRGGLLATAIALAPFIWASIRNPRALTIILLLVIFCTPWLIRQDTIVDQFNFAVTKSSSALNKEKTEARSEIIDDVLDLQTGATVTEWLIGRGRGSVEATCNTGLSAHNDMLQMLFDHGLLAAFCLVGFSIQLIRFTWRALRTPWFNTVFASTAIFLVLCNVSHLVYYPYYFIVLAMFFGFATSLVTSQCRQPRIAWRDDYYSRHYS